MTEQDIVKYIDMVVEKTVASLQKKGLLKNDDATYGEVSYMLTDYYQNGQAVPRIERVLEKVKHDEYFDIIPMYYGDGMKIDDIAGAKGCDTSTIVRNKKRLCLEIYTLLM